MENGSYSFVLIGGRNHGRKLRIDEMSTQIHVPVYVDEEKTIPAPMPDIYLRRRFYGDEFGKEFVCYGYYEDDEVETMELARKYLAENLPSRIRRENN